MQTLFITPSNPQEIAGRQPNDLATTGVIDDMAKPVEKRDLTGILSLILTVLVVVVPATLYLDSRFTKIIRRLDSFDSALRIISKSQPSDSQDLIKEILTQGKDQASLGNPQVADKFLAVAQRLTIEQAQKRATAGPEFFKAAVQDLDQLRISPDKALSRHAREIKVQLAAYRSSLNTPPDEGDARQHAEGGLVRGPIVQDFILQGGRQPLDGINWINATFINVHIIYHGTPTELRNVNFVNCTFEISDSPTAEGLINIAILGQTSADMG